MKYHNNRFMSCHEFDDVSKSELLTSVTAQITAPNPPPPPPLTPAPLPPPPQGKR